MTGPYYGDRVRVKCSATGRYIGDRLALVVSAMSNELFVDEIAGPDGAPPNPTLPVPSDEAVMAAEAMQNYLRIRGAR